MKKLSIISLIILSIFTSYNINAQTATNDRINWMNFEEAIKLNETNPKKIFIDVYTDWCGWCKKMDQTTFIDKDVVAYMNENFYAVKFNAEQTEPIVFNGYTFSNKTSSEDRRGTHELAQALLQGNMSYPSYAFMSENNQLITVVPGYIEAYNFLYILKYIGSDAFKNQSWEEYFKRVQ